MVATNKLLINITPAPQRATGALHLWDSDVIVERSTFRFIEADHDPAISALGGSLQLRDVQFEDNHSMFGTFTAGTMKSLFMENVEFKRNVAAVVRKQIWQARLC